MGNIREVKKCYCGHNINLNIVKNIGGINDIGYWIIRCDKCKKDITIKVKNPNQSIIISGAVILSRNENVDKDDELQSILVLENCEEDSNDDGDDNSFSLAVCPMCNKRNDEELGIIAELLLNKKVIEKQYCTYFNGYVKNWYGEVENVITYIPIKCICGYKTKAIFGCKFSRSGDIRCLLNQNFLGIKDLNMECLIDGIYSKTECMNIIERFALRWNFIANNIYIVTPYIGHQYIKNDQLQNLWEKIKEIFDSKKTKLITKTATHNKYKNTVYAEDVEDVEDAEDAQNTENSKYIYDTLVDYGLENTIASDYIKKNDFHCKLYFAVIGNMVEALFGSANILYGKSLENLYFKQYDLENFTERYINRLHIKDIKNKDFNNLYIDIKGVINNKFDISARIGKNHEI